jgi:capsular exopolysaccharide synthesis family protein
MSPVESRKFIGNNLNFAAAEAYKRLRSNLDFAMPDASGCKIIGVTSSVRSEGKTTTSINLAYTIAQTGKRVLLIEADLRLPNLAKRLNLPPVPGLSNLLAGQADVAKVIQPSRMLESMFVVTAGDIPPNPAELLSSDQMEHVVKICAEEFDAIIVDLPPVQAVSDAQAVSKLLHGILIVVRQNHCDRSLLDDSIRQLRFTGVKILGFVMTGSSINKKEYGYYGK